MTTSRPGPGIDAAILDRMTDTLAILQAKDATPARARYLAIMEKLREIQAEATGRGITNMSAAKLADAIDAAVLADRDRDAEACAIPIEGHTTAEVIRNLAALERTSLGTPGARQVRARVTARRVADILTRHEHHPDGSGTQGEGGIQYEIVMGPAAERAVLGMPYEERKKLAEALRTELLQGPNADREVWFNAGEDKRCKATPLTFGAYVAISRPMTTDELARLRRERRRRASAGLFVIDILHPGTAFTVGPRLAGRS
jgi:hypothetical protein